MDHKLCTVVETVEQKLVVYVLYIYHIAEPNFHEALILSKDIDTEQPFDLEQDENQIGNT
jgi:hypothetical protein